ncbi:general negative regulator of transcription [Tubulinosema ratisbonensis]|uniref:General negative regulator of transcription n=1 Tax=Tubulinosema ratisbonensis TaxID=291195 RepID=A0A437AHH1_9MICR|nr:general negative regulator of transcription [Tubulinosema ratisbonensis]
MSKLRRNFKKDVQDDELFQSKNITNIKISNLEDEYLLSGKHKKLKDKILEKLIPQPYRKIEIRIPPHNLLHEETLLYIFYMLPYDKAQESAFYMLLDMGYKYFTPLKYFLYFSDEAVADNKKRRVVIFDPFIWEKVTKDIVFDKEFISSLIYKNTRFVRKVN